MKIPLELRANITNAEFAELNSLRCELQGQRDELAAALREILVGVEMESCTNFAQSESCRRVVAKIARAALAKLEGGPQE